MIKNTALSILVLAVGGCASVVIPPDNLEREQASMRAAKEVGADAIPDAKLHLQLAEDETATAKKLAADGDDRANLMLSRAEADAELAVAMAREVSVHSQALAAAEDLKAVQARGNANPAPTSTSSLKGSP